MLIKKMGFRVGPVLGLITNHKARILVEVKSTGDYILRYGLKDENWNNKKFYIQSDIPVVFQISNLKSNSVYYYEVLDQINGERLHGTFKTLYTSFSLSFPCTDGDIYSEFEDSEHHNDVSVSFLYRGCTKGLNMVESTAIFHLLPLPKKKKKNKYISEEQQIYRNRDAIRNCWNDTTMKNLLSSYSNIFLCKGDELNNSYRRSLLVNPKRKVKDYFLISYGKVGYFITKEGDEEEQIQFFLNQTQKEQYNCVEKWVFITENPLFPTTLCSKLNKEQKQFLSDCKPMYMSFGRIGTLTSIRYPSDNNKITCYQCTTGDSDQMNKILYMMLQKVSKARSCVMNVRTKDGSYKFKLEWSTRYPNFITLVPIQEGCRLYFNGKNDFTYIIN